MASTTLIRGATPVGAVRPVDLLIEDGRLTAIAERMAQPAARQHSAEGLLVAPGFIDLQINGSFGTDFTEAPETMWSAGEGLAAYGVTAFLPTIVSSPPQRIAAAIAAWRERPTGRGARVLGLHLEGPFLAASRRGAHPADLLRLPDPDLAADWNPAHGVRMVTVAPELPGAGALIRALAERGVVVSVGHTEADAEAAARGVDAGARYATHLFNAMPPLGHRAPGAAGALLLDDRVTLGLIVDGAHLDPRVVALAWRVAGPRRISLVTDAIAGLGQPPGRYRLGDDEVIVEQGTARRPDGTLAGGVTGLDAMVRNLVAATGCAPAHAVATVTEVPARVLGLDEELGRLAPGRRADLVLLTPELHVAATFVAGEPVFVAEGAGWD